MHALLFTAIVTLAYTYPQHSSLLSPPSLTGVCRLEDPDTRRSQLAVEALLQRDLRQPILEREFPGRRCVASIIAHIYHC